MEIITDSDAFDGSGLSLKHQGLLAAVVHHQIWTSCHSPALLPAEVLLSCVCVV